MKIIKKVKKQRKSYGNKLKFLTIIQNCLGDWLRWFIQVSDVQTSSKYNPKLCCYMSTKSHFYRAFQKVVAILTSV